MNAMIIKVLDQFGPKCLSAQKGEALYSILSSPEAQNGITLDFEGVTYCGSQFLNNSVSKLLGEIGYDKFKSRVQIINYPTQFNITFTQSIHSAIDYYKLPEDKKEVVEALLSIGME